MQIREAGRKVLLIKTEYSKDSKRTYGRTVASQDKYLSTVTDDVRQRLAPHEVDEFQNWLSKREENNNVGSAKSALSGAGWSIRRIANALSVDGAKEEMTTERAASVYAAMDELAKALKKAGFKKPLKPTKTAKSKSLDEADPRQVSLL